MKNHRRHIIFTWILLFCFAVGQVMVYAHQHPVKFYSHQTSQNQKTLTEKCQLCDAMHHHSMLLTQHQYFSPVISSDHFYTQDQYDFVNIALILSAGRAPPLS